MLTFVLFKICFRSLRLNSSLSVPGHHFNIIALVTIAMLIRMTTSTGNGMRVHGGFDVINIRPCKWPSGLQLSLVINIWYSQNRYLRFMLTQNEIHVLGKLLSYSIWICYDRVVGYIQSLMISQIPVYLRYIHIF